MESMLVLAALLLIGGPILLFFLVVGARSRLSDLEAQVQELQAEVRGLRRQGVVAGDTSGVVEKPAEDKLAPAKEDEYWLAQGHEQELEVGPESQPIGVFSPSSAFASETRENPETPVGQQATASVAPNEVRVQPEPAVPFEPARSVEYLEARDLPPPPAWMLKAKEWLLGGNLVAKVGLLILFIGVSFLLKYAAARVTVPIEFRLAGIVLADIGLLLWGWSIRESRPAISLPVQGGALGILMLVTFGAFRLYELIPGGLAFALLFFLTFFTCVLAVLQDAIWLAVFGIVGGFAAPIMTSTGHGSHIGLFSYYALLNAGILAIALKRSWRLLNLLGFVFTFLIATAWGVLRYAPENYLSAQGFLILFFVFYVAIAVLYASRQAPRLKHYVDGTLVFGTPLAAFGLQYGIVHDKAFGLAFSALALGLFYIGLTLALWRRRGDSLKLLVESFLALGIVFGTLAIPFALDGRWTAAAWALEGAGIVWVGLRQKQVLAWGFGVLVQVGAWVSFIASVSGLQPEVAATSNLWLGFLLLAVTGLLMAMNFRRELERGNDEEGAEGEEGVEGEGSAVASPAILTVLSTVFLGFAAAWLLAGAWNEILLRASTHLATLLVLSAMAVAGILIFIAARLRWGISRYFSLLPQVLAGGALLWLMDFDRVWSPRVVVDNLFETDFLGALMITLGAAFTGLIFHRQPDDSHRRISRPLLVWSGLWWFAVVLGIFNAWGEHHLAGYGWYAQGAHPNAPPLYYLLVAIGAPVFVLLSRRLQWADLRWLACAVWPGLLLAQLVVFAQLDNYMMRLPAVAVWFALIALWLSSEWLLHDGARDGWLAPDQHPRALRVLHTLRTVGPWLILWPLVHNIVALGLRADSAEQAALLADAGWSAAGSWSRYLPAWVMMGYIALLIPRARDERWPTQPIAEWYRGVLIPLGAVCSLGLVVLWNLTQNGRMEPLPYLPILNPLDLTTGFAALLAIAAWRMREESADSVLSVRLPQIAMIAAYVWFNLMLLRTAAHFLGLSYDFEPLFRSQFVQAMLSLVWSATALVLMRFAAKRLQRTLWMAGASLLALVVAKLFMIDLSNIGGIERIISFLGVGVLMLAIGYLAPFPSDKTTIEE